MNTFAEFAEHDFVEGERLRALVPPQVAAALPSSGIQGFEVSDDASDTAACAARYGIAMEDCANTIVVRFRKAAEIHFAAVVVLATDRIDVNGALRTALGAQRISFADRESVTTSTQMEYGGVTAFGLPVEWPILVDASVMTRSRIVMGAGTRLAKLLLEPRMLLSLPNMSTVSIAV